MTPRNARTPSQRQLRVGEALRHALADVLLRGELRDPALHGVSVTVSEVRVSPDLRSATAYVMPLGGAKLDEVMGALRRATPFLRTRLAHAVRLRYAPELHFEADTSFDQAQRIDALLHEIRPAPGDGGRGEDGGPQGADGNGGDGGKGNGA